jgi:ATP-dependent Lon protease
MNKKFALNNFILSDTINEDTEFFPLMSDEDEKKIDKEKNPEILPILPLKNTVLFPGVIIPITIAREKSIQLIKDAEKANKLIGVLSQKDSGVESPTKNDLNSIGTVAQILKMLKMPDGNITAVIQGRKRFELHEVTQESPYFKAKVNDYLEKKSSNKDFNAVVSSIKDLALRIIDESPTIPSEASIAIKILKVHLLL